MRLPKLSLSVSHQPRRAYSQQIEEVELHVLNVELRSQAIAYLQVERFSKAGHRDEQKLVVYMRGDDQLSEYEHNDMPVSLRMLDDR